MLTAALVFGILGGLSAVMGGLTLGEVIPLLVPGFDWTFWFAVSIVLLLSSIACGVLGRRGEAGD